ncbi:Pickpocket protein 28 [Folsomia candida]|uniref:Pickpocket protein 28 n=1 Tax=Folsomia candida TaxID=158441 RepID=A0A226E194_FOLCA|nr:Pickpocket protein 28 [Folsomia candida]
MLNFDFDNIRLLDFGEGNTFEMGLAAKIIEGTTKCTEMMLACTFNSIQVDCSELFKDIYTESGPACSFNSMPSNLLRKQQTFITMLEKMQRNISGAENDTWKAWNVKKNFQTNITRGGKKIGIPEFQEQEGEWFGFEFVIKYPKRGKYCRQSDSSNYRMTVNFPLDEPNLRDHGRDIPPGYKVINVIKPRVIMAEEDSRPAPPEKRGCYFATERKLAFYNSYTESNCWRECTVNATLKNCGCSRVYHPRNSDNRICSTRDDEICANGVESNRNGSRNCKCLPGYNEITYEMTTTLVPYPENEVPELVQDFLKGDDDTPTSIVITYMEAASVLVVTSKHRFDWFEQLGLHGGNWGLTSGLGLLDLGRLIFSVIYVFVITGLVSYVAKCCWCSRPEESHSKMAELYMTAMTLPMGIAMPDAVRVGQLTNYPKMPQIVKDYMEDFVKSKQPELEESDVDHENENGIEVITEQPTSSSPERPSTAQSESKSRKLVRPKSARAIAKSKFPYWTVGNFLEWFPIRYGIKIKQSLTDDFDDDKTGQCCCTSCFPCCNAKDEVIVPLAEVIVEKEAVELVDEPVAGPSRAVAPANASTNGTEQEEASQSDPVVLEEEDFEEMWRRL